MIGSFLLLLAVTVLLAAIVLRKAPDRFSEALRYARSQGEPIALRIPLALLGAMWLSVLIPPEKVSAFIGAEQGLLGIVIATGLGAFLPGGPMVAFPVALIVWKMGAGTPQMVALLTSWGLFALHRAIAYEIPIMGMRFVALKFAVCFALPPLAGLLAAAILALPGF